MCDLWKKIKVCVCLCVYIYNIILLYIFYYHLCLFVCVCVCVCVCVREDQIMCFNSARPECIVSQYRVDRSKLLKIPQQQPVIRREL